MRLGGGFPTGEGSTIADHEVDIHEAKFPNSGGLEHTTSPSEELSRSGPHYGRMKKHGIFLGCPKVRHAFFMGPLLMLRLPLFGISELCIISV